MKHSKITKGAKAAVHGEARSDGNPMPRHGEERTSEATGTSFEDEYSKLPPNVVRKKKLSCTIDCSNICAVFRTLLYRIWMYRKHNVLLTVMQLLVPPLILIFMTLYMGHIVISEHRGWTHYKNYSQEDLRHMICKTCTNGTKGIIGLTAKTNPGFANKFYNKLQSEAVNLSLEIVWRSNFETLQRKAIFHELTNHSSPFIGIVALETQSGNPKAPYANAVIGNKVNLHFDVIMADSLSGFTIPKVPAFFDLNRTDARNLDAYLGIESLVCSVFYNLIEEEVAMPGASGGNGRTPVEIELQSLSYPPHTSRRLKPYEGLSNDWKRYKRAAEVEKGIDSMVATILVLSMIPAIYTVVGGPVSERENGFKVYLHLMGFPRASYWFQWILNQMIVQSIVAVVQTMLILLEWYPHTGPLVKHGHWFVWYLVLLATNLCSLSFFALFAAFHRREKMGVYISITVWLLSFQFLHNWIFEMPYRYYLLALSCLIPGGCIHWAVFILSESKSNTWEAAFAPYYTPLPPAPALWHIFVMMGVDILWYFFATLYIDNLTTGLHGQPWNYFFESFRCRCFNPRNIPGLVEASSRFAPPAVVFENVSKKFYWIDGVYGVRDVQLEVPTGHITAVLGHKDSGRSTLVKLLCGAYTPTKGTVKVFGYDVRWKTQRVQCFISVCLEENYLCEYMTVKEHMIMISKLTMVRGNVQKEIERVLISCGMYTNRHDPIWKLLIYQRRMLSVAMALLGDAPVLCLDEPTAGLDLDGKRQIWALLKSLKQHKTTIFFTTSDVQEVYEIADKVAVMSRGQLAASGTWKNLEKVFDVGYHLSVVTDTTASKADVDDFIKRHVAKARKCKSQCSMLTTDSVFIRDKHGKNHMPHHHNLIVQIQNNPTRTTPTPDMYQLHSRYLLTDDGDNALYQEYHYILPWTHTLSFPDLFQALSDPAQGKKLGIIGHSLHFQSIQIAFSRIDDYLDALNAATDFNDDYDIEEMEEVSVDSHHFALKKLVFEMEVKPLIKYDFPKSKNCCAFWKDVWALCLKKQCYLFGRWQQGFVQFFAPLVMLFLVLVCTNLRYVSTPLSSSRTEYPSNIHFAFPVVPYRIDNSAEAKEFFNSFKKAKPLGPVKKFENLKTNDFEDYLDDAYYSEQNVAVAADFTELKSKNVVSARYPPTFRHAAPIALLSMYNAKLDYEFNGRNTQYSITMRGSFMFHKIKIENLRTMRNGVILKVHDVDMYLAIALSFGFFIFSAGFVSQPCSEAVKKLKRYQVYQLKSYGTYWIANGLIDFCICYLFTFSVVLLFYFFPSDSFHFDKVNIFSHIYFMRYLVFTGAVGGFTCIIYCYVFSNYLVRSATSYYVMLSIFQFVGLAVCIFVVTWVDNVDSTFVSDIILLCLQLLQPCTLYVGFLNAVSIATNNADCFITNREITEVLCSNLSMRVNNEAAYDKCCTPQADKDSDSFDPTYLTNQITRKYILYNHVSRALILFHLPFAILVLTLVEWRRRRRNCCKRSPILVNAQLQAPKLINTENEEGILSEKLFVAYELPNLDEEEQKGFLVVEDICVFNGKRFALYPLTFHVKAGECLVVVGPETAGITTLYDLLAGLRKRGGGNIKYGGYSLFDAKTRKKFLRNLGLSPASSNIIDSLTGYQHLALFGRLRGIPEKDLKEHINYWTDRLGMQKQRIPKYCTSYSNTMKRKLSIACALIGNPPVIILEEPTTDLDPLSKAQLFQVIKTLRSEQKIVLILTHDLVGLQEICNKLVILVNGQVQLIETMETVRKTLLNEYMLTFTLRAEDDGSIDIQAFSEFCTEIEATKNLIFHDEKSNSVVYRISGGSDLDWAQLFTLVESVVQKHSSVVATYNLRTTRLEDIYESYVSRQKVFRKTPTPWEEYCSQYL